MSKLQFSTLSILQKEQLEPVIIDDLPWIRHALQTGLDSNSFDLFVPVDGDDAAEEMADERLVFVSVREDQQQESLYLLNTIRNNMPTPQLSAAVFLQAQKADLFGEGGMPILKSLPRSSLSAEQRNTLGMRG